MLNSPRGKRNTPILQCQDGYKNRYCLTVYDVIVLDDNHRGLVCHLPLYGQKRKESMDWFHT